MTHETEMRVRKFLWLGHPHTGQYGDDGEMQCIGCAAYGCIDYRRAPLEDCLNAYEQCWRDENFKKLAAEQNMVKYPFSFSARNNIGALTCQRDDEGRGIRMVISGPRTTLVTILELGEGTALGEYLIAVERMEKMK